VNLLLVHEQDNPCTCRLLRQVAALLSPQSVALPVPLAEHVLPIAAAATEVSDELAPQAMYASLLLLANAGKKCQQAGRRQPISHLPPIGRGSCACRDAYLEIDIAQGLS
jgi:hypothetical protein